MRNSLTVDGSMEMLIHWLDTSPEDATWEQVDILLILNFLTSILRKLALLGAGNDWPPIVNVYTRRHKMRSKGA